MSLNLQTTEFKSGTESSDPDEDPSLNVSEQLSFSAGFGSPKDVDLDGFNDHGVRKNTDEDDNVRSVDVVYEGMEPGNPDDRNGVRVTESFLRQVAEKNYSEKTPFMLGHSEQPLDEIGKLQKVWFSDSAGKLMLMNRVFNTGAPTHNEVVKRLTHDPPTMTDGSVGFGDQYEAVRNKNGEPELVDGEIKEFSTTPFPGGYDDGGLGIPNAAFAEKAQEAANFDDGAHDDSSPENMTTVQTKTISF